MYRQRYIQLHYINVHVLFLQVKYYWLKIQKLTRYTYIYIQTGCLCLWLVTFTGFSMPFVIVSCDSLMLFQINYLCFLVFFFIRNTSAFAGPKVSVWLWRNTKSFNVMTQMDVWRWQHYCHLFLLPRSSVCSRVKIEVNWTQLFRIGCFFHTLSPWTLHICFGKICWEPFGGHQCCTSLFGRTANQTCSKFSFVFTKAINSVFLLRPAPMWLKMSLNRSAVFSAFPDLTDEKTL